MMGQMTKINGQCSICLNVCDYDEDSFKASSWNINGEDIILCLNCEDELRHKFKEVV